MSTPASPPRVRFNRKSRNSVPELYAYGVPGIRPRNSGQQPHAALDHYYARARLLFLPSVNEELPMVIPEAQRWGLPVVTAEVGEVGDLVQTDGNGCLAHPHDQVAFANAILRLLDDPAHWTRLAAGASATYRQFAATSTLAAAIPPWQTVLATLTNR